MRHITIIISILLLLTCFDNSLFGQADRFEELSIDNYTRCVDSVINQDKQVLITRSIAEGQISQETATTKIVGHDNKVDTIRNKTYGGWGKYSYANSNGDTVYKIEYHDNLQKNFYLIFYYRNNLLVYSKLDYQENGIGQTFYKKEEYYKNDKVIFAVETKDKIDETYKRRADINLYAKGYDYYKDFLKDK